MRWLFIFGIRIYQWTLGPILSAFNGGSSICRYEPTCSVYAHIALRKYGSLRGSWLAAKRLFRCAPWGDDGYDPVPGTTILSSARLLGKPPEKIYSKECLTIILPLETQEPGAVENNEESAHLMQESRSERTDVPERTQRHQHQDKSETEPDILVNDLPDPARKSQETV